MTEDLRPWSVLMLGAGAELMATARDPQGLYEVETNGSTGFVDVPRDDYRSTTPGRTPIGQVEMFASSVVPAVRAELGRP